LAADVVGNVAALDRVLEVAAREIPRAELEIEHAELELHARQVRVEEQHTFQGADRRLVVAARGRLLGELEADLQVRRVLEHLLEKRVVVGRDNGGRRRLRLRQGAAAACERRGQQTRGHDKSREKFHSKMPLESPGRTQRLAKTADSTPDRLK
jgi:hypothetical protein